jgi:hypothetical protein
MTCKNLVNTDNIFDKYKFTVGPVPDVDIISEELNELCKKENRIHQRDEIYYDIKDIIFEIDQSERNEWIKWVRKFEHKSSFITKSWLKMYEVLIMPSIQNIIKDQKVDAFFNSELPGGFLLATHHMSQIIPFQLDWMLSSYVPQTGQGDFFADRYNLKKLYPHRVLYGEQHIGDRNVWVSGDVINKSSRLILVKLVRARFPQGCLLFTSDGGFECNEFGSKEYYHCALKFGEASLGMMTCKEGGIMFVKLYGCLSICMKSLVALLAKCFDSWQFFKPQSSNPTNEEFYFLGIGYHFNRSIINHLLTFDKVDALTCLCDPFDIPQDTWNKIDTETYRMMSLRISTQQKIFVSGWKAGNLPPVPEVNTPLFNFTDYKNE